MSKQPKKQFHKTSSELLEAVGSALAMWSLLERSLNGLFCNLSGLQSYAIAEAIMSTMVSFRGRLEIIDNIFLVEPQPQKIADKWVNLRNRLLKRSKERNGLAHFSLVYHGSNAPGDGYAVAPLFNPHIAAARGEPLLLTASEIAQIEQRFLDLSGELGEFSDEFRQQKGMRAKMPGPI
jgi:hypothetical protein